MEDLISLYEDRNEKYEGPFASLGDALLAAEGSDWIESSRSYTLTAEGPERVETTEWREYLAAADVTNDQTPRERLADYFGVN